VNNCDKYDGRTGGAGAGRRSTSGEQNHEVDRAALVNRVRTDVPDRPAAGVPIGSPGATICRLVNLTNTLLVGRAAGEERVTQGRRRAARVLQIAQKLGCAAARGGLRFAAFRQGIALKANLASARSSLGVALQEQSQLEAAAARAADEERVTQGHPRAALCVANPAAMCYIIMFIAMKPVAMAAWRNSLSSVKTLPQQSLSKSLRCCRRDADQPIKSTRYQERARRQRTKKCTKFPQNRGFQGRFVRFSARFVAPQQRLVFRRSVGSERQRPRLPCIRFAFEQIAAIMAPRNPAVFATGCKRG
jgi:hypothetical protein